jgi:protein-disulfide isomerase
MIGPMAHRLEQKAAARVAREAGERRRAASRERRRRLELLGAMGLAAVAAIAAVIAFGAGAGGKPTPTTTSSPSALATVRRLLVGIPQTGTTLGSPSAPVTITEYGDLVCPVCAVFATTTEPQLIAAYVRTGRVKLVFRGLETASMSHNHAEYPNTIAAVRSAGLQHRAWDYIELAYYEQPQTIGGVAAEETPYITPAYLQGLAAQVPGLNLSAWQANTADASLLATVAADAAAAQAARIAGTPAEIVSGPNGSVQYNAAGTLSAVPTLAQLAQLIDQVG